MSKGLKKLVVEETNIKKIISEEHLFTVLRAMERLEACYGCTSRQEDLAAFRGLLDRGFKTLIKGKIMHEALHAKKCTEAFKRYGQRKRCINCSLYFRAFMKCSKRFVANKCVVQVIFPF